MGRLLGAYRQGRNYLRGLDNRLLEKWGAGHGLANRQRRDLGEDEKRAFYAAMQADLAGIERALQRGAILLRSGDEHGLQRAAAVLQSVHDYGYEGLQGDGRRFNAIYKPISILPPDQYLALVLQATEGCSYNRCTFCSFYRDRPFRIKTDAEYRAHMAAARSFLGPAQSLRTTIFLADANALVIPQQRLLRLLDLTNAQFDFVPRRLAGGALAAWKAEHPQALRGIYSFVDAFTIRHKGAAEYAALAERNVRRVYIGMESGSDDLLRFLNKGSSAGDAIEAVRTIKAGGVAVAAILMLGVGGERFAAEHVRLSIRALNDMGLGQADMIYFSPFVDEPGAPYHDQAAELGIAALTPAAMDAQVAEIRAGLRFDPAAGQPKIALYDIREFIY